MVASLRSHLVQITSLTSTFWIVDTIQSGYHGLKCCWKQYIFISSSNPIPSTNTSKSRATSTLAVITKAIRNTDYMCVQGGNSWQSWWLSPSSLSSYIVFAHLPLTSISSLTGLNSFLPISICWVCYVFFYAAWIVWIAVRVGNIKWIIYKRINSPELWVLQYTMMTLRT